MKTANFDQNRFVLDPRSNASLRATAKQDQAAAIKDLSKQFEGLMLQMILKSMREAMPKDGLFDSDQSRFFMSILDQQLAQNLAANSPTGFATMLEQQLTRNLEAAQPADGEAADPLAAIEAQALMNQALSYGAAPPRANPMNSAAFAPLAGSELRSAGASESAPDAASGGQGFVQKIWPHAVKAGQELGVPPQFVVAHSALESGWGKHEIRLPDGKPSHNLFGVKAGKSWKGASVEITTTEYENGVPRQVRAKFRVYPSYADAFDDYAELLRGRARFAAVVGQKDGLGFARSLQDSGYATDPLYANKLNRIIGGETLKQAMK